MSTSLLNCVPYLPACQCGLRAKVLACQRGLRANVPACQHAKNVPTSHFYVSMCQQTSQRPMWLANFSTWHANVPNGVPIFRFGVPTCQKACQFFRHSFYEILREVSTLSLLYKKFFIILHIIVIHIICIVHKNCIKLNFYTSCHIKQKCVEFFFFIIFLLYSLVRHEI